MKCPDCGTNLTNQASAAGIVVRCFKCGGFWVDAATANNLTAAELANWRRISVSSSYLSGGSGRCPADGLKMEVFKGDQIPINVVVDRCLRCGRWWFPGDNLFRFKPALEAKKNYLRLWGLPANAAAVMLPLLLVAILAGGVYTGVKMVGQRQQTQVAAKVQLSEVGATYLGQGRAMIVFRSNQPVTDVAYRNRGDDDWKQASIEENGEYYVVWMEGLEEGSVYRVRVMGEEYRFVAK